jgi:hypothetical protein
VGDLAQGRNSEAVFSANEQPDLDRAMISLRCSPTDRKIVGLVSR